MGILDDLLGTEEKSYKEKETASFASSVMEIERPLTLLISFLPLRLSAKTDSVISMIVKITNKTEDRQIISFEVLAPKDNLIGFDKLAINKHYEKKLGHIEPGATVEFSVPIYGTAQTKEGNYSLDVAAYIHYLDYDRVVNYVKRKISVRVA